MDDVESAAALSDSRSFDRLKNPAKYTRSPRSEASSETTVPLNSGFQSPSGVPSATANLEALRV